MIIIKSGQEIEILRQGGKILAGILKEIKYIIKPGATTGDLENLACKLISQAGGRPSFKNYRGKEEAKPFPTSHCTSINNEVVHAPALPSRQLESGDIIGLDIGMEYPYKSGKKGYFTDMAETIAVGKISKQTEKLLKATKESLRLAIENAKPGNTLNDIGGTIQKYIEANGFSVVRDLVGHGVGKEVHEDPPVPNYIIKDENKNILLKPGMVIAIEPMVNIGSSEIKVASDGLTILTKDNSLSAHFEHSLAITKNGNIVLTSV